MFKTLLNALSRMRRPNTCSCRRKHDSAALFSSQLLEPRILLTSRTWTGADSTTDFAEESNWSPEGTPLAADDLTLTTNAMMSYTVDVTATRTVNWITTEGDVIYGLNIGSGAKLTTDVIDFDGTASETTKLTVENAALFIQPDGELAVSDYISVGATSDVTLEFKNLPATSPQVLVFDEGTFKLDDATRVELTGGAGTESTVGLTGDGALVVTGSSVLTSTDPAMMGTLEVGNLGIGNVTISDYSDIRVHTLQAGIGSVALGDGEAVIVLDATATLDSQVLELGVGYAGEGTVTVLGGDLLAAITTVGKGGVGTISLQDGAQLFGTDLVLGTTYASVAGQGSVTVSGASETGTKSQINVEELKIGGVESGDTGIGKLTVKNDAWVVATSTYIGLGSDGVGAGEPATWLKIDDATLDTVEMIIEDGKLEIRADGNLNSSGGDVGNTDRMVTSKVVVSGPGAKWNGGVGTITLGKTGKGEADVTVEKGTAANPAIIQAESIIKKNGDIKGDGVFNGTNKIESKGKSVSLLPGTDTDATATFTFDTPTWDATAGVTYNVDIAGLGDHDVLDVTGNADLGGVVNVNLLGFTPQEGDSFDIITVGGSLNGAFDERPDDPQLPPNANGDALIWDFEYDRTDDDGDGHNEVRLVLVPNQPPEFDEGAGYGGGIVFSVEEDEPIDTVVGTLTATDPDSPPEDLTYALLSGGGGLFAVDAESGNITVAGALDYETQTSYSLEVEVSDPQGATDVEWATIDIIDVDDEPPEFNDYGGGYSFSVSEDKQNGYTVGTVSATDPDTDSFELTYSLVTPSVPFAVNAGSGAITVAGALDFETTPSYQITVRVDDPGGNFDETTVTINVQDVDDEPPVFDPATYAASVAENAGYQTSVAQLSASDPDTTFLSYWISGGDPGGVFSVDSSGEVFVDNPSGLDYETTTSYGLTVTVSDGPRQDQATVNITVLDVDDEPPEIEEGGGYGGGIAFSVAEDAAIGTVAGTVTATDPDTDPEDLTYALLSGGGLFAIDAQTGEITVEGALDYESQTSHFLSVEVRDPGDQTDTASVTIDIIDVDDEPPEFNDYGGGYSFSVYEDATVGTTVDYVNASDPDTSNLTYSLVTTGVPFAIDSMSGAITVAGALDYETTSSYAITARVDDTGGQYDEVAVTINVQDVSELHASAPAPPTDERVTEVTIDELRPFIVSAIIHWQYALPDVDVPAAVAGTNFEVVDLPGTLLGTSALGRIQIDVDAAGYGWFVDPSPLRHSEFEFSKRTGQFEALSGGPADGRMDLLTVLLHEVGHLVGEDHVDPKDDPYDVLTPTLEVGVRRLPERDHIRPIPQRDPDDGSQLILSRDSKDVLLDISRLTWNVGDDDEPWRATIELKDESSRSDSDLTSLFSSDELFDLLNAV